MTFNIIHLLQASSNAISNTVVQQSSRIQLTESVAQSLCNGRRLARYCSVLWTKLATDCNVRYSFPHRMVRVVLSRNDEDK